jgi:hypothetical protein
MNEDQLRRLLAAEANKIVPSPRAWGHAERRATQLRKRRMTTLAGVGSLAAAAAVVVAVMMSINSKPTPQPVTLVSPPTTSSDLPVGTPTSVPEGSGTVPTRVPTTVKSGSGRCHTSELAVTTGPVGAAAGNISASFVLTNTSKAACTLFGYPGFSLLDSQGQRMIGDVHRGASPVFPAINPTRVVLAPRKSASFSVGYSDVPTGNDPCRTSVSALITPPDETTQLTIADQAPVCGGPFYVSPVVTGSNGASP